MVGNPYLIALRQSCALIGTQGCSRAEGLSENLLGSLTTKDRFG
jgi:hypothetical protein